MPTPFKPPAASLKPEAGYADGAIIDPNPTVWMALLHLVVSAAIIFVCLLAAGVLSVLLSLALKEHMVLLTIYSIIANFFPLCAANFYLAWWLPRKFCYAIGFFWAIIFAFMTLAPLVLMRHLPAVNSFAWMSWCSFFGIFPITWATIEFTQKYQQRRMKAHLPSTADQLS